MRNNHFDEDIEKTLNETMKEIPTDELGELKYYYPDGKETANYYTYTDLQGVVVHYNKYRKKHIFDDIDQAHEVYEFPESDDEISKVNIEYDSDPVIAKNSFTDSISKAFHLETIPYKPDSKNGKMEIADIEEILFNTVDYRQNVILISPPGSGKTDKVKEFLKEIKQKFIFLVPLRLQVEQMGIDTDLFTIKGGDKVNLSKVLKEQSFIVTTYEYFMILDKEISNKRDYYLVVDEYHKLVSDSDYRTESLDYISNRLFDYARFIGLTGTPYGCINKSLKNNNVGLIKVELQNKFDLIKGNYNLIRYKRFDNEGQSDAEFFYGYIKENLSDGINIVFANNKKLLRKIKNQLLAENIIDVGEYIMLSADEKHNPEVIRMIRTREIPSNKKIVFSTSVISTGINLDGANFENVFICKEYNMIELIQFIYRFREGIVNVHDLIPKNSSNSRIINIEEQIITHKNIYKKLVDSLNRIYMLDHTFYEEYIK